MLAFGGILFLISSALIFGADQLFKRGKITTLKSLLIVKMSGLTLAIIATLVMIYGT